MKTLSQFITDNTSDIRESLQFALEVKGDIKLPYTFDIYNKGAKNVDYKLTKANIYKIYHAIPGYHDPSIELPVAAHKLRYSEFPTKESTKNWTEIPKIYDYTSAEAFYTNYYKGMSKDKYDRLWREWFDSLAPYFKGKLSITFEEKHGKHSDSIVVKVNNEKFNKDREEKLKEMKDIANLKKWADEADAKEKAAIEKARQEAEKRKKEAEEYNKWYNSLSDEEKLSRAMGYGVSGKWTGD